MSRMLNFAQQSRRTFKRQYFIQENFFHLWVWMSRWTGFDALERFPVAQQSFITSRARARLLHEPLLHFNTVYIKWMAFGEEKSAKFITPWLTIIPLLNFICLPFFLSFSLITLGILLFLLMKCFEWWNAPRCL